LKLQPEIKGGHTKIDNLVNAVAEGILPREIVKDKLEKLREDKMFRSNSFKTSEIFVRRLFLRVM
jgi:hypothetical protein